MLKIHTIYGAGYDSNVFILEDTDNSGALESAIVDAGTGAHASRVRKMIEKFVPLSSIRQIILTHGHYDHTGGAAALAEAAVAKVLMHELEAPFVEEGRDNAAAFFGGKQEKISVARKLKDGDKITVGKSVLEVLHTPGHAAGSICLYHAETLSLISGDTVFSDGGMGRWDLVGGNYAALAASVKRLCLLDVENLYPGHGYIVEGGAGEHLQMAMESL